MFRFSFFMPTVICGVLAAGLFVRPAVTPSNPYYREDNNFHSEYREEEKIKKDTSASEEATRDTVEKIMKESAERTREILEGRFGRE